MASLTTPSPSETPSSDGSQSQPLIITFVVIANVLIILIIYFIFLFWKCNKGSIWDHEPIDNRSASTDSSPCSSPRASGIKEKDLSLFPEFVHGGTTGDEKDDECAVCITELVVGQIGRVLPACGHKFHIDCIDTWLRKHYSCPICRMDVREKKIQEEDGKICLDV